MSSSIPPVDPENPEMDGELLVTEIAFNLLGNELYNIYGEPEENLSTLLKNNSRKRNKNKKHENIDVLKWLDSLPMETDCSERSTSTTSNASTSTSNTNDNNDYQLPSCKISTDNSMFLNVIDENFDMKKFNSFTIDENNYKSTNSNQFINLADTIPKKISKAKPGCSNNQFINITDNIPKKISKAKPGCSNDQFINKTDNIENEISKEKRERLNEIQNSLPILKQQSSNKNVLNLIEDTEKQYKKIKYDSKILENNFLKANANLINSKILKKDEVLEKFYAKQRSSLVEEAKTLVEFMRIVKNQDDIKKEVFREISKDILEAKKHLSLNN